MKTFVLSEDNRIERFKRILPPSTKVVGWEAFEKSSVNVGNESLWVTEGIETLTKAFRNVSGSFFKNQAILQKNVSIYIIGDTSHEDVNSWVGLFKDAIFIPRQSSLPIEQMFEVIKLKHSERYVVGGQINELMQAINLIRGDFSHIVVPLSAFSTTADGVTPDFANFTIEDHGQTLKFGEYEASVDAILYEFDPVHRKARRAEQIKKGRGLGASLRRLRLQKGLRQTDLQGIDAREIGRIERNEVKPRKSTLDKIAKALGVSADEIKTY